MHNVDIIGAEGISIKSNFAVLDASQADGSKYSANQETQDWDFK